jgi:P4 family phage/plasmid primase-like protien
MVDLTQAQRPSDFDLRLQLAGDGWRPIPLWARKKEAAIKRWSDFCTERAPTEDEIAGWPRTGNTGIACGHVVALDLDIDDEQQVRQIQASAIEALGETPLIRQGRAPRVLLVYRAAAPFKRIERKLGEGKDAPQIEILADGQQFAAFGTHPNGNPFRWIGAATPLEIAPDDLPAVTREQVVAWLDQVAPKASSQAGKSGERSPNFADGRKFSERSEKREPKMQPVGRVQAAVDAIPNDDLDHDEWIDVGYRIRGARWDEAGFEIFDKWSAQSSKYGVAKSTRKAWDSFKGTRYGRKALFEKAKEYGWQDINAYGEDGLAQLFTKRYADDLRFDHHQGRWYRWDGARWQLEETNLAFNMAREVIREAAQSLEPDKAGKLCKASVASAVERLAAADRAHAVTSKVWDRDHMVLGTPHGTVDLRTGRLREARKDEHITRLAAVTPDFRREPRRWVRFLHDATAGDEGLVRFIQQMAGYCLTGDVSEHALFFLYGPGGNGKSVLLDTMNGILGEYSQTAVMDTFTASAHDKHTTDLAMLRGARLVSVSETEEGRAWAETRIKQLTGGDEITARFMRQDNFTFKPQFKLVIVGNHKPVLRNVDDAVRRRFNIIPFDKKPPEKDPHLSEKLREEWPAILAWMIEGALDWQANGLVRPAAVDAATEEYFEAQDTFGQWLEECCEVAANEWEAVSKLYQSWCAFAERQGDKPGSQRAFVDKLNKHGFVRDRARVQGQLVRIYRGVSVAFNPAAAGIDHD